MLAVTMILLALCIVFASCGESKENPARGNESQAGGGQTLPEQKDDPLEEDAPEQSSPQPGEQKQDGKEENPSKDFDEEVEKDEGNSNEKEGQDSAADGEDSKQSESSQSQKAYTLSEDGKRVQFGRYPTKRVEKGALFEALNAASKETEWTAYGYFSSGEKKDFMYYQDVEYDSATYRGVYFTQYRPNDTRSEGTSAQSYQDDNGFETDTVYWFAYEPISWRILEKSEGTALIVSENVLDSHEFFPAAKGEGGKKANDYQNSSLREFLNGEFYRTAFSEAERTNFAGGGDKLSLLSYEDVTRAAYFSTDAERALGATDYAMAQGLNMSGGARWWLGSANETYDFYAKYVDGSGYAEYNQYVYFTSLGVVPALKLKLFDGAAPPAAGEQTDDFEEEAMTDEIFLWVNGHKISVKLEQNEATKALIALLKQGDITYTASDYGGFEKVGSLGHTLPRSDTQMTTEAGDVILYLGNQIVLFYGSNAWSYTKLGHVQGISAKEWKEILTQANSVSVTISLK